MGKPDQPNTGVVPGREYRLVRSARRTLALEITREGTLLVRAPMRAPRAQIDAFVESREGWIAAHLARWKPRPEPDEAQQAELIRRAREMIPGKVARYAPLMGVNPAGVRITGARTRFGSCSSKGRLCFSWRLMQYPEAAIDYVVVHELAHLRHMDHSSRFYAVVESVLPDWRQRRAMLNK